MTIKGKDLIERISDKEYSEELLKELEKYEVKRPKSVWELLPTDKYWITYFNQHGYQAKSSSKLEPFQINGLNYFQRKLERGYVHLSYERAKLHARVLNTELSIKKWKRENDDVELDWGNESQKKCYLMYYGKSEEIRPDWFGTIKSANTIYFSSESKAEQCINDIGKERIIEWIKWEDNDQ